MALALVLAGTAVVAVALHVARPRPWRDTVSGPQWRLVGREALDRSAAVAELGAGEDGTAQLTFVVDEGTGGSAACKAPVVVLRAVAVTDGAARPELEWRRRGCAGGSAAFTIALERAPADGFTVAFPPSAGTLACATFVLASGSFSERPASVC